MVSKLLGEAAETILPLAGKAASPSPLALPPGKPTQGLQDSLASAMADVGRKPKNVYNKIEFDPFEKASEVVSTPTGIRVGHPEAFPLDLNTLPIREYEPVVHKVRVNKGQTIEEAMPADLSKMKSFDIIDLSGEGTRRQRRLFEVMPDGSIVRFKGNRPFAETTMKTVKRYGTEVLEFKNQWVNEALTKTGKRVRPGQLGSMQVRAAGEKAVRAFGVPEGPLEPGQFGVTSQGRARTMAEMQREELGPLARTVGYTADAFVDVLINKSVPGDINWGRLNSRGKLGITKAIHAKKYSDFKEKGAVLFTQGFQRLHEPLMDSTRNRFKTQRQRNILKAFDRMAADKDTYDTNERLMLSLLDMMPDEMVERLAISVRKEMPDAAAHYVNHPAAGVMTLTLKDSTVHTFFHEFMHHIQTFIAPEDLEDLALQFKRAFIAEDAQGLISTLYYSNRTRIKNEADLIKAIELDNTGAGHDIYIQWIEMRGGTIGKMYDAEGKRIGLSGKAEWPKHYGLEPKPTDDDFKAIIDIMKESGKLPPDFLKAANPAFDVSKYGFATKEIAGEIALGGALPGKYEMGQLESMLYRYTNFNEYLAEVFADRMLVNAAAKMLRDEKYIGLFDRILELLTDWFVGAYNWALRHGRKDLVDDIIRRIQRGDFNSMTYDKAQRELERPYDTWLSETGGQRGSVAGSANFGVSPISGGVPTLEVGSGMGGKPPSVFDTLGRIRQIEGGEQGGGAFAQSPQLQPTDRWGSRGVATEVERAEMNEYLKQARAKWGVGPLGHRQTGPAGQELQPPYQPFPVEKTQEFLRNPRGTVGQEIRTGRLEDPIISRRGMWGRSPEATPSKFPEGSDEWVNEQARTIIDAYMSGSITGNEAGSRIIGLKRMVRLRDMEKAKAEGTPFGLSVLYEQLERTGDQLEGGYIDDVGTQPLKDILPSADEPVGGGPIHPNTRNPDSMKEVHDYQSGVLEPMVHENIWGTQTSSSAATYRYMLEGAGDAFREIAGNGAEDYIEEKLKRIVKQFTELRRDVADLPDEAIAAGKGMRELVEAAPVYTPRQEAAADLMIAVIDRDIDAIKEAVERIRAMKPLSQRERDLVGSLNREVEGLNNYGLRNEFVEPKRGPAYMFVWSNAQAKWYVGRRVSVGGEVRLDANQFIGYGKKAELEAVAERLDPLPLFSGGPMGGSFEYRASQTPSGGGMPMRKDITDYLGKVGEAGIIKPPEEPPTYG